MQNIFIAKESDPKECRVALTALDVAKLVKAKWSVKVESNAGVKSGFSDQSYIDAGAEIVDKSAEYEADFVVSVNKPSLEDVAKRKAGSIHMSFIDPFNDKELIKAFADANVTASSLEMIPRSTIAQKMDALSSQANLAGYMSVLVAAQNTSKVLPMMMTPCGTLSPLKFFIIGVGVAGLQAIATAKRLGARVEAYDTRPVVEEQVKSLGAKFVKIDVGETGQTAQGYAKELTPEQLEMQRKGMIKVCSQADVIITTAKTFGRKAPVLLKKDMLEAMKSGSVVIDLAIEAGGNVEGAIADEVVITENGVKILAISKLESMLAGSASQMLSANFYNFINHFSDKEGVFTLNMEDDITKSCIVVKDGEIRDERFK